MAKKAAAGGGPGTQTASGIKSTLNPVFGKRVAGKRGGKRSMSRGGRSR